MKQQEYLFGLTISYWNIEGLHDKVHGCKIPFFEKHFNSDIEILSESWGNCKHEKDINDYHLIQVESNKNKNIKKGRNSGGLLIYFKNHLLKYIKLLKKTENYVWLEINKTFLKSLDRDLYVCIAYNPPEVSQYHKCDLIESMSNDILSFASEASSFFIMGDFNARTGNLKDYDEIIDDKIEQFQNLCSKTNPKTKRRNCDSKVNSQGEQIINLCKTFDLMLLNGRAWGDFWGNFTHYNNNGGASTIDICFTSCDIFKNITNFRVCPQSEISSHCRITAEIDNKFKVLKKEKTTYEWSDIPRNDFCWDNFSKNEFMKALESDSVKNLVNEVHQFLEAGLVESSGRKLQEIFQKAASLSLKDKVTCNESINSKKGSKSKKKWYDNECKKFQNKTRRVAKMKNRNPLNNRIRKEHKELLKEYKKLCGRKKNEFWKNQNALLSDSLHMNDQEFWNSWKNIGETYQNNNIPNVDPFKWFSYFSSLFKKNTDSEISDVHNVRDDELNEHLNQPFTLDELRDNLNKLKNNKAPGLDGIKNEMIKCSSSIILEIVLSFFNLCLSVGIFSSSLCKGIINPIHKEGPRSDPESYRGICLMNCLTKLLCSMMNERVYTFLQNNQVINKAQIGFLKGNRTTDHILTLKSIINKYVHDGKGKLYACFVDFRKAFDSLSHQKLFLKMRKNKINGNILRLLQNIYKNSECSVRLNGKLTQFFAYEKGVIQGNPISPILFNIYVNDLFEELAEANKTPVSLDGSSSIHALMFADDLIILSTSAKGLQDSLDRLNEYCNEWDLKVNFGKTKCIAFSRGNSRESKGLIFDKTNIEFVKQFKYLGVSIDKKGNFSPTLKDLSRKATNAIFALKSRVNFAYLSTKAKLKLFDSLISPILLYGSEIWESYINQTQTKWDANDIEKVHLTFIKSILGVNRTTANVLIRAELGRYSLKGRCLVRNINYTRYLNKKTNNSLVKQAFEYEIRQSESRNTIISSIGYFNDTIDHIEGRHINIFQLSKMKLKDMLDEYAFKEWKTNFDFSSKSDTYREFKNKPRFEKYLGSITDFRYIKTLTKFRLSDHNLMIEEGRRIRPKVERGDRLCKFCSINAIEDEIHFLINCSKYKVERTILFEKIARIYPNFNAIPDDKSKFIFLMTQENIDVTKMMAFFLKKSFETRSSI